VHDGEQATEELIRGQLERVTYVNRENGYSVYRVRVRGEVDAIAAVGYCAEHIQGEEIELSGKWTVHPKFGIQFQFSWCRQVLPSSVEGIRRYMGSGLLKGVGPAMAERIIDMFGESSLEILDREPDELLKVKGIGRKTLDSIKQSWESQRSISSIMYFLQNNGISPAFAAKIFRTYGAESIQVVRDNPYRLADDIFGIGFLTADKVASQMNISHDSPMRIDAGVKYALGELTGEGHVYAPRELLAERAGELLGVHADMADAAIGRAAGEKALILDSAGPSDKETEAVYLPIYHVFETSIAKMLTRLLKSSPEEELSGGYGGIDADSASRWVQDIMRINLAENQLSALHLALKSKVLIITGGPGTGKTTLIRAIIGILGERGIKIELAAPTGRAAKRMTEATGKNAVTIHRLLESNGHNFGRNADSPLECGLLIVDEASMIDVQLMYYLLRAIPPKAHLILVGDTHQLPSVGPGNVLGDLMASGEIPVSELNVIFRQARDSGIIVNAHRVNEGLMPSETVGTRASSLRDFYFIEQDDPFRCVEIILTLIKERIPKRFGLDPTEDVQVLTPMHKGALGASNLNSVLQRELNMGPGNSITVGSRVFRTGDKVMQIKNDYEKGIYNGDIGLIRGVDANAGLVTVKFDENEVCYEREELDEIVHAYAVSIHKSQGSEYPAVIIPVHTQHYVLLQRNLLYTGITRAKELAVLVGTKRALSIAVKNDKTRRRYTNLGYMIKAFAVH
jgi:exodeoxyribonuclease V alpha subunit